MANNKGKQFEQKIRQAFEEVPEVSIDRIPDQTMRYKGARNICDFIVYREPYEYYIECKSVHGTSLPFINISQTQWDGLLEKSKIEGVKAGIICWWVDKDVTKYIPIVELEFLRQNGVKSFHYNRDTKYSVYIEGKKKRIFFDYNMEIFFEEVVL